MNGAKRLTSCIPASGDIIAGRQRPELLTDELIERALPRHRLRFGVAQYCEVYTRQRHKRGMFRSVIDLQVAINRFVAETNLNPKPFVWTADPKRVLAAVKPGKQTLESGH
jgi:hypothetical protein